MKTNDIRHLYDCRFSYWVLHLAFLMVGFGVSAAPYDSGHQSSTVQGNCGMGNKFVVISECVNLAISGYVTNGSSHTSTSISPRYDYSNYSRYIITIGYQRPDYDNPSSIQVNFDVSKGQNLCQDQGSDGSCVSAPEPIYCNDPQVSKDVQHAQYACQIDNPNTQLYDVFFDWSCSENPAPQYPTVKTSCNYEPNNCVVGLNCPTAPNDNTYCDPATDECTLPDSKPESDLPNTNPLPDIDPSFCELHPILCQTPEVPESTPEPNPNPDSTTKPDNPDLPQGDNEIVKEISESNDHLENINHNIKEFDNRVNEQLKLANELNQHQLGALKDIASKNLSAGAAMGGVESGVAQTNEKLDKVACLLDDGCESPDKKKPSVKYECSTAFIFSCEGDVIQCEILKATYENMCIVEELVGLEKAITDFVSVDSEAMLVDSENTLDYSQMDTKYLDNGVSFGVTSGCPAPLVIDMNLGSFFGSHSIEWSYEPACKWAEIMNPLAHLAGWIVGLFIIFRAGGGA